MIMKNTISLTLSSSLHAYLYRSQKNKMAEAENTGLMEQIAEIAECPICTDKVNDNRLLPCGHTFCLKCLDQYKRSTRARGRWIQCPLCRKESAVPKGGCSAFPKNIMIEKVLEVKSGNEAPQCDTCKSGKSAGTYCIQCEQNFCDDCEKLHNNLKITVGHQVIPVQKDSQNIVPYAPPSNYCEYHLGHPLELVCYDCDTPICWKCRSFLHSSHNTVEIQTIIAEQRKQCQSCIDQIRDRLSTLSTYSESIESEEEQFRENFEKEKSNVHKVAQDLIRIIEKNEGELLKHLTLKLTNKLKSLEPLREQNEKQINVLKEHITSLEQMRASENDWEIFRKSKEMRSKSINLVSADVPVFRSNKSVSKMSDSNIQYLLMLKTDNSQTVRHQSFPLYQGSRALIASYIEFENPGEEQQETNEEHQLEIQSNENATEAPESPGDTLQDDQQGFQSREDEIASAEKHESTITNIPVARPRFSLMDRQNQTSSGSTLMTPPSKEIESERDQDSQKGAQSNEKEVPECMGIKHLDVSILKSILLENGSAVNAVAVSKQKIFVAIETDPDIIVYRADNHEILPKLHVHDLKKCMDIVFCKQNDCLYLADWKTRSIFRVETEGSQLVTNWSTEKQCGGISLTYDSWLLLSCYDSSSLIEYCLLGTRMSFTKIISDQGESIRPWHALKLSTGEFVISHGEKGTITLHRVCLISSQGFVLKSFGGQLGSGVDRLCGPYHLAIDDRQNLLFVADCNNKRILILDTDFNYVKHISTDLRRPRRMFMDAENKSLLVTDNALGVQGLSDGKIVVYSVNLCVSTFV